MTGLNSKTVSIALALILFVEAAALADGNTQTMGISCFIPAIPGLNAPLDEEQAPREEKPAVSGQNIQPQEEKQEEPAYGFGYMESQTIALPAYAIAEDTQEVRASEQAETPQLVQVKTLYSR